MCVLQEVAGLKEEDLPITSPVASTGDPSSILSESHSTHMLFSQCVIVVLLYTGTADLQSKLQVEMAELKEEDLSSDICSPTPAGTGDPSSILSESHSTYMLFSQCVIVLLLYTGTADLQSKLQEMAELKEEDFSSDTCSPTPAGTGDPSNILSE